MNFLDKTGLQYFWGKIKNKIDSNIAANDAMTYKGTIGTGGTITSLPASHKVGDTYKVITSGNYADQHCEVGDMIICVKTGSTSVNSDWTVVQSNIDGAVTGPTSSTNAHVAVFNGSTGKIIKDSGFTIAKSVPANAVFTDTTYSEATTLLAGLMSVADKIKLDGITGSGDYVLPAATSTTLGGVKIGSNITNSSGTISVTKLNVTNALGYTPISSSEVSVDDIKSAIVEIGSGEVVKSSLSTGGINLKVDFPSFYLDNLKFSFGFDSDIVFNNASDTYLGCIRTGYSESGKNYKVQVDSEGRAFVYVPWTDTQDTAISTSDIDEICV